MESLEIFRVCSSVVTRFFPERLLAGRVDSVKRSHQRLALSLSLSPTVLFTVSISVCLRVRSDQGRLPAARLEKKTASARRARFFICYISARAAQRDGTSESVATDAENPGQNQGGGGRGAFIAKERFIRCLANERARGCVVFL